MTARQVLNEAIERLSVAGIEEASNDAWVIFSHAFEMDRTAYLMHSQDEIALDERYENMNVALERRANREPLQYIMGSAWFMGHEFMVAPGVLIPRFDTEILVEQALKRAVGMADILDMCTGSGCIAISMGLGIPQAKVVGVDISDAALTIATENGKRLSASNVSFVKSNMFDSVQGRYDMILSNPPYIPTKDIEELAPEVKVSEPMLALDGHEDGLFFYRILAEKSPNYLKENGVLCMEIGYNQAEDVCRLLSDNQFADIEVIKDLVGLDRVVCGRRI